MFISVLPGFTVLEPSGSRSLLDGGESDNSSLEDDDDIDSDDERFKTEVDEVRLFCYWVFVD